MTASTCSATGSKLLGEKPLKNSTYTKIFYFGNLCAHEFQLQKGPGFWVPSAPSAKRDLDLGSHKRNLDFRPQKGTWIFGRWKSKNRTTTSKSRFPQRNLDVGSTPKGTWIWGPTKGTWIWGPKKEPGFLAAGDPKLDCIRVPPKEPGCGVDPKGTWMF